MEARLIRMSQLPLIMVLLPLLGALLVLAVARGGIVPVRRMVLTNVLLSFILSVLLVANYDPGKKYDNGAPQLSQMMTRVSWLGTIDETGKYTGPGPDIRAGQVRG